MKKGTLNIKGGPNPQQGPHGDPGTHCGTVKIAQLGLHVFGDWFKGIQNDFFDFTSFMGRRSQFRFFLQLLHCRFLVKVVKIVSTKQPFA